MLDRGRLVIFTALPEQIKRYWLSAYFPEMMAEAATMPDWNTVEISLRRAGFRTWTQKLYFMPPQPVDMLLYSGKDRPISILTSACGRTFRPSPTWRTRMSWAKGSSVCGMTWRKIGSSTRRPNTKTSAETICSSPRRYKIIGRTPWPL